jgi:DNA-directed RNA polymerase sigma subunit (sigma70/sigma32)
VAGLLSALALAVTPIIVTSRNNTTIRVPVHMTEKIRKVSRASGELSAELG